MSRRRSIISLQLVLTFTASVFMLAAEAIQLGDIRTHSAIGEPLDATVGVWLTAKDKQQSPRLKVLPYIAYRANSNIATMVAGMSAELTTAANGTPYIQLRSDSPINEPALAFRVKVYVGENAVMRNYSLALNPPPPVRRTASKRQLRTRAPITDTNYTVSNGDTLWAIARRVSRTTGAGTNDLITQIFADNPHAFVNGNRDRLILGAELRLPLESNTTASAEPATPRTVAATPAVASTTTVSDPVATTPAAAVPSPSVATQASQQSNVEPRQAVDWRQRDPQLAAELERLRLKYQALKQQYDTQRQRADVTATASAPVDAQGAAADVSVAAQDTTSMPESAAPETVVTTAERTSVEAPAAEAAGTVAVDAPTDTRSARGMTVATTVALACAGLALLALVALAVRKGLATMKKRKAEVAHHAREADFKAEVARKAANRVQMESEVQRMLANRDAPKVAAASVNTPPGVDGSAGADAEIDHNIAHGRYNEAEAQLIAVIAANPKNYSAKLRLLEVYYMLEEVDSFCDVADDLHANHRADLSDDEWRRVIRMGKVTAPDRMPFSGPRGLDIANEAS